MADMQKKPVREPFGPGSALWTKAFYDKDPKVKTRFVMKAECFAYAMEEGQLIEVDPARVKNAQIGWRVVRIKLPDSDKQDVIGVGREEIRAADPQSLLSIEDVLYEFSQFENTYKKIAETAPEKVAELPVSDSIYTVHIGTDSDKVKFEDGYYVPALNRQGLFVTKAGGLVDAADNTVANINFDDETQLAGYDKWRTQMRAKGAPVPMLVAAGLNRVLAQVDLTIRPDLKPLPSSMIQPWKDLHGPVVEAWKAEMKAVVDTYLVSAAINMRQNEYSEYEQLQAQGEPVKAWEGPKPAELYKVLVTNKKKKIQGLKVLGNEADAEALIARYPRQELVNLAYLHATIDRNLLALKLLLGSPVELPKDFAAKIKIDKAVDLGSTADGKAIVADVSYRSPYTGLDAAYWSVLVHRTEEDVPDANGVVQSYTRYAPESIETFDALVTNGLPIYGRYNEHKWVSEFDPRGLSLMHVAVIDAVALDDLDYKIDLNLPIYNEDDGREIKVRKSGSSNYIILDRLISLAATSYNPALRETDLLNNIDASGRTPLYWAVMLGSLSLTRYLIDKGADVSVLNQDGQNLLHAAAAEGHVEIYEYLHSQLVTSGKLDPNLQDKQGLTPLALALSKADALSSGRHLEVAQTIAKMDGVAVDKLSSNKQTTLEINLTIPPRYLATLVGQLAEDVETLNAGGFSGVRQEQLQNRINRSAAQLIAWQKLGYSLETFGTYEALANSTTPPGRADWYRNITEKRLQELSASKSDASKRLLADVLEKDVKPITERLERIAESLVRQGVSLTSAANRPLILSLAQYGWTGALAAAKDRGEDLNIASPTTGMRAIDIALKQNNNKLLAWLIDNGADLNQIVSQGGAGTSTLAATLIERGENELLAKAYAAGADANITAPAAPSQLLQAIETKNAALIQNVLNAKGVLQVTEGNDVDMLNKLALLPNGEELALLALRLGAKPQGDISQSHPLAVSIQQNKLKLAQQIMSMDTVNLLEANNANGENFVFDLVRQGEFALLGRALKQNPELAKAVTPAGVSIAMSLAAQTETAATTLLRLVLEQGASADAADNAGHDAYDYAVRDGSTEAVRLVLSRVNDLTRTDARQQTRLMRAVISQKANLVEAVGMEMKRRTPELLSAADIDGNNALHHLVLSDSLAYSDTNKLSQSTSTSLDALVSLGVGINAQDKDGNTPLMLAIKNKNIPLIGKLMTVSGVDLMLADKEGYAPIFRLLEDAQNPAGLALSYIEKMSDTSVKTPASKGGRNPLLFVLSDVNYHYALSPDEPSMYYEDCLQSLASKVDLADVDVDGNNALNLALKAGLPRHAVTLMKMGAAGDVIAKNGENALALSLRLADSKIAEEMVGLLAEHVGTRKFMALCKLTDNNENSMVMQAAQMGRYKLAADLLSKGANITQKNSDGDDVLHVLARAQFAHNQQGQQALEQAVTLLAQIAKVKTKEQVIGARNSDGQLPLNVAVQSGNYMLAKTMLELRLVDPTQRDANGENALDTLFEHFVQKAQTAGGYSNDMREYLSILSQTALVSAKHQSRLSALNSQNAQGELFFVQRAMDDGDLLLPALLFNVGLDVNATDSAGMNATMALASRPRLPNSGFTYPRDMAHKDASGELMNDFVSKTKNLLAQDSVRSRTALHYSIAGAADVGDVLAENYSPAHTSIIIDEMQRRGDSFDTQDNNGDTALMLACERAHLLLQQDYRGEQSVALASEQRAVMSLIAQLINAGADPTIANTSGSSPLHYLATFDGTIVNGVELAKTALQKIAKPQSVERLQQTNADGHSSLHLAAAFAQPELVALYARAGADMAQGSALRGDTAAHFATHYMAGPVIQLEQEGHKNAQRYSDIVKRYGDVFTKLAEAGVNLAAPNKLGYTPLMQLVEDKMWSDTVAITLVQSAPDQALEMLAAVEPAQKRSLAHIVVANGDNAALAWLLSVASHPDNAAFATEMGFLAKDGAGRTPLDIAYLAPERVAVTQMQQLEALTQSLQASQSQADLAQTDSAQADLAEVTSEEQVAAKPPRRKASATAKSNPSNSK